MEKYDSIKNLLRNKKYDSIINMIESNEITVDERQTVNDFTPLMFLCLFHAGTMNEDDLLFMLTLLKKGANVNSCCLKKANNEYDVRTMPLSLLIKSRYSDINIRAIKLLIEYKAELNPYSKLYIDKKKQDYYVKNVISNFSQEKAYDVLIILLNNGCKSNILYNKKTLIEILFDYKKGTKPHNKNKIENMITLLLNNNKDMKAPNLIDVCTKQIIETKRIYENILNYESQIKETEDKLVILKREYEEETKRYVISKQLFSDNITKIRNE